jgi:hypothetical protein
MTPIDLGDQVIAALSHEDRLAVMERFNRDRKGTFSKEASPSND